MPNKSNDKSSGSDPRASARPSQTSELASSRPPDDADVGTFGDEPGLLDRVSSAAASFGSRAAEALEPSEGDRSGGSSLLDMDDSGGGGASALERLGDDRDRGGSSALFDMTDDSSGGPSAFDRLDDGRDRGGSSSLFNMDDDSGGGMTAFDRLGDDDGGDTTAQDRLERLGEADDSEDLYG